MAWGEFSQDAFDKEENLPAPFGPDAVLWQLFGNWQMLAGLGSVLLLQVAHPAVGAGVGDYSVYQSDPWGRLTRTLTAFLKVVYAGGESTRAGKQIRTFHKNIKGMDHKGRPYHAWNAEAYTWVHMSGFATLLIMCDRFGPRLNRAEIDQFYAEFRQMGKFYGVREDDMPADVPSYWAYFDATVGTKLENHPTVHDVLSAATTVPPPPGWWLPAFCWTRLLGPVAIRLNRLVTVGTLPPDARKLFNLKWGRRQERMLNLLAFGIRCGMAMLPGRLRYMPIAFGAVCRHRTPRRRFLRGIGQPLSKHDRELTGARFRMSH